MRIQSKLAWITMTMCVLGAGGTGLAQSAPVRAASPAPGAPTKKVDTSPVLDLSKLVAREATENRTVAGALVLPGGGGGPIQSAAGGGSLQMLHGDTTGAAATNAGHATSVVPVSDTPAGPAAGGRAGRAEAVIRGQINPAAKACYESDPDSKAKHPGRLVLLIKLTPAGDIDSVDVPINLGLSPSVVGCITAAARAATFAAPGGNGATVRAAFAFGKQEDPPSPATARASVPRNG